MANDLPRMMQKALAPPAVTGILLCALRCYATLVAEAVSHGTERAGIDPASGDGWGRSHSANCGSLQTRCSDAVLTCEVVVWEFPGCLHAQQG